jgi:hypothetical protein
MGISRKRRRKFRAKFLRHLREDVYCRLGQSSVHGVGVFAIRTIPKGVNPLKGYKKYREIRYSWKELNSLPSGVRKLIDRFCYYENGTILISTLGLNTMDIALYVNHSKNPNVSYAKRGRLATLKSIKHGEELTMNYDANFGGKHVF